MSKANKTKIQILGFSSAVPPKILLQKFCLLRTAEKEGDIEVVNNTQLGRLNDHNVKFAKLPL
jgi:hypothetical protein